MSNVVQFVSRPVSTLWAPRKGTKASWRVLAKAGSVVEFKAPPVKRDTWQAEIDNPLGDTTALQVPGVRFVSISAQGKWHHGAEVSVIVHVEAARWHKLAKQGNLGQLYGVDISNAVYRFNSSIPASMPTVDDRSRAKRGFKRITLTYHVMDPNQARALGLQVRMLKSGAMDSADGYVNLYRS